MTDIQDSEIERVFTGNPYYAEMRQAREECRCSVAELKLIKSLPGQLKPPRLNLKRFWENIHGKRSDHGN